MKRRHKISLRILVIVLALVLALGTALAWTLVSNQYFEDVAKVESEHGYYDRWNLKEKLILLQLMKDNGVAMNLSEADALLAGGMGDGEREARIDALVLEKYGVNGRMDVISLESILTKELGDFDSWPMAQKAWYSQMLIDSGLMGGDDDLYRMPGENAIPPEEAVAVARKAVAAVWTLTESDLSGYRATWVYRTHATDRDGKLLHYEVTFTPANGEGQTYRCPVSNDGKVLTSTENGFVSSPAEDKAAAEGEAHENDQAVTAMVMSYGEAHGLGGQSVMTWPLEDKLALTEQIRPVIEAHMAADPRYANEQFMYYASHRYGLPDGRALPLKQAVKAAQNALVSALGVPGEIAARCTSVIYYYDVTDPDAPLWKITLAPYDDRNAMEASGEKFTSWLVRLNAWTGDIVKAQAIDLSAVTQDELIEIRN